MARPTAPGRVFDLLLAQYEALAVALELTQADAAAIRAFLVDLRGRSRDPSLWRRPSWSAVTDDCSPFEWSVVSRRGPSDLRLLFEASADPGSPTSYWAAGRDLTEWLTDRLGCDADPFHRVADLFEPGDPDAFFVMWHGIEWREGRTAAPRVKLYLNPAAGRAVDDGDHGERRSDGATIAVTRAALQRLGFGAAWDAIANHVRDASLSHVAVDLASGRDARLKVYLRSPDRRVLRAMYGAGGGDPEDVTSTFDLLTGSAMPERLPRPAFVVLHLTAASRSDVTRSVLNLHVPSLHAADPEARDGIRRLLAHHGLDATGYLRAVDGLARSQFLGARPFRPRDDDPLAGQIGLHSYLSFQRESQGARVTTYFAPRAYAARFGWGAVDPVRTWSD